MSRSSNKSSPILAASPRPSGNVEFTWGTELSDCAWFWPVPTGGKFMPGILEAVMSEAFRVGILNNLSFSAFSSKVNAFPF